MKGLLVTLVFGLAFLCEEAGAHGTYIGPTSYEYTFLGCCGASRTSLEVEEEARYYYENTSNDADDSWAQEQAPGNHWHVSISTDCVDGSHLAYRSSCDGTETVCEDEWVLQTPHYARCPVRNNICNYRAENRYEKVYWKILGWHVYYWRWVEEEVCREVPVP